MIGHTKAAAGLAGLIKAALALHHRVLPPHRGVDQPNAEARRADSPLYLHRPRRGPGSRRGDAAAPRRRSARSASAAPTSTSCSRSTRGEYRDWPDARPSPTLAGRAAAVERVPTAAALAARARRRCAAQLGDASATSRCATWPQPGRRAGPRAAETLAIVAKDVARLQAQARPRAALPRRRRAEPSPPGVHHGAAAGRRGKIAFLFPGQGSQYPACCASWRCTSRCARDTLSEADACSRDAFAERFGSGAGSAVHPPARRLRRDDKSARAPGADRAPTSRSPRSARSRRRCCRLLQRLGVASRHAGWAQLRRVRRAARRRERSTSRR